MKPVKTELWWNEWNAAGQGYWRLNMPWTTFGEILHRVDQNTVIAYNEKPHRHI